jgi:hypothetical protein
LLPEWDVLWHDDVENCGDWIVLPGHELLPVLAVLQRSLLGCEVGSDLSAAN